MKNVSVNHQPSLSAESSITNENENVYSTNHALDVNISGSAITGDVNLTEVGGAAISLGQTTMSASLPVTIASNQSALPVSQSGTWNIGTVATITNPVTINGTVAATQSGNWSTRTLDGSGNSISSTGGALNVNISSGNITGFATSANQTNGTQLTQIVDAGGDAVTVTGGKLDVNATISGSGGCTSSIDKAAFTIGSDTGTPIMGIYQSSLDTISNGTVAVAGLTSKRGLFVNLQNSSGTEIGTNSNPIQSQSINQDLVDSNNSSTATLTANSTFTGTGTATANYSYIMVYVYSDQSSASNGVKIEFSSDNINWNDSSLFTFTAGGSAPNDGQTYGATVRAQYYRVVYTNGGTGQSSFRLQTVLKEHSPVGDMVTMVNVPNSTNHALLTKSSIVGLTTGGGGGYVDVKVNPSGTLTVDGGSGTGSAVPGNAYYIGLNDGTNLVGATALADNVDSVAPSSTVNKLSVLNRNIIFASSANTWNRQKSVEHGLNSSGVGHASAGILGEFDDTSPTTITENQFGTIRISSNRNLYTTIRDAAGNERGLNIDANGAASVTGTGVAGTAASGVITVQGIASMTPVQVSQATASNLNATVVGTGTFATQATLQTGTNSIGKISDITTSIVPGTGATNLGKAEDAAHTDGDTGVFVLSRRIDAQASSAGSTGDYAAFNTDSAGGVYVTPSANAGVIGTAIYNNTALSSTKQAVNASAGNLYGYHIYNPNSVVIYIQLFNLASASVTVGSTSPTAVIAVPPLGWADATPATPISFSTALTIAATTTSTGSGTPTTALLFNCWYK